MILKQLETPIVSNAHREGGVGYSKLTRRSNRLMSSIDITSLNSIRGTIETIGIEIRLIHFCRLVSVLPSVLH